MLCCKSVEEGTAIILTTYIHCIWCIGLQLWLPLQYNCDYCTVVSCLFFLSLCTYWLFAFSFPQLQSPGDSSKSLHNTEGSRLEAGDSPVLLFWIIAVNLIIHGIIQNSHRAFKTQDLPLSTYKLSAIAKTWLPDPKWGTLVPCFVYGKSQMLQKGILLSIKIHPTHICQGTV